MGKDEDDQGDAEIARIIEHESIAARFQHGRVVMADMSYDIGDDEADDHEDGNGCDDIDARRRELGRIDIGKNETGNDQEKHELRQGLDIEVEFLIEEITEDDEKENGKHRVFDDEPENHEGYHSFFKMDTPHYTLNMELDN